MFIFSQSLPDGQHRLEDKYFLNTGAQCLGPQQAGAGLPWPGTSVASYWKNCRAYSSRCQVTSDNHLSLACGPCSADQVRCFSPGWIFRGTQRVCNDDVWSSGQVCPLLERKCPQDQLITESRAQFTLCLIPPSWHPFHRDLCLEVPSLATLTLSLSFAYILLGFSAPTVLLKSPGSIARSWRLLWIWSSNFSSQETIRRSIECVPAIVMPLIAKVLWGSE